MTPYKKTVDLINQYSLEIFNLLYHHKTNKKSLFQAILSHNKEYLIKQITSKPLKEKYYQELVRNYSKKQCLDEIINLTDNRYHHLKEIRNLVDITDIVKIVVPDYIYQKKLKIHYTDLIIDYLVEDYYDYSSLKLFTKYREYLITLDEKLNLKIIRNIDRFYIKKITI